MRQIPEEYRKIVVVERNELIHVKEAARQNGARLEELRSSAFEPITTVAVALVGAKYAVDAAIRIVDEARGGQIIDLRDRLAPKVYRTKDLSYGLILIRLEDGSISIRVNDKSKIHEAGAAVSKVIGEIKTVKQAELDLGTELGDSCSITRDDAT